MIYYGLDAGLPKGWRVLVQTMIALDTGKPIMNASLHNTHEGKKRKKGACQKARYPLHPRQVWSGDDCGAPIKWHSQDLKEMVECVMLS